MPKRSKGLAPRERKFVDRYLIHLNATKAATEAGYSKKTARSKGSQLLTKVNISEAIKKKLDKQSEKLEITQDRIAEELAYIAFGRIRSHMQWTERGVRLKPSDEISEADDAAISAVEETEGEHSHSLKIKKYDKLKALELLGKYRGMFIDAKPPENTDPEDVAKRISAALLRVKGKRRKT